MASSPDVIGPRPSCVMQYESRDDAFGVFCRTKQIGGVLQQHWVSAPSRIHRKSDSRTARETGKATLWSRKRAEA
ncbi:hypothetical protein BDV34DRAFT_217232 [Aspergillus parasiticus]|uniref:Uncharacterized protein n=1 Tax=Aspergillus parasiticus TaxID=5067 RepID=A0A5N6D543_ASPPA|nr:hypothetical protein BDV34DRAFT_217232 [Aspergillus parasiticus]